MDLRNRQPLEVVIYDPQDSRLSLIQDFGEMCLEISGIQGKRKKQLSLDTASAIHHTSKALVELTKNLLTEEGFDYVCLAEFLTDRLEKAFGQLREGSRGTYFINVQQV